METLNMGWIDGWYGKDITESRLAILQSEIQRQRKNFLLKELNSLANGFPNLEDLNARNCAVAVLEERERINAIVEDK